MIDDRVGECANSAAEPSLIGYGNTDRRNEALRERPAGRGRAPERSRRRQKPCKRFPDAYI